MTSIKQSRNIDLDFLKGIAIVAIVLYHTGLMPLGYLGVDLFFCLNGYFITRIIDRRLRERTFGYGAFLRDRLVRLWPVLIIVMAVALLAGYLLMLPDDYENLGNSVVASSLMANNILANITIMDYWAVRNVYQPLMHTWYLGVLVQCYLVFPAIIYVTRRLRANRLGLWILWALLVGSVALYLCPEFADNDKFYYLPFRLFEFLCGALVALYLPAGTQLRGARIWWWVVVALLVACLLGVFALDHTWLLVLVVALSMCALLIAITATAEPPRAPIVEGIVGAIAYVGAMSYSLYLWHQVVIAYYRYSISDGSALADLAVILGLTIVLALLSYYMVERPLSRLKAPRQRAWLLGVCLACALAMAALGLMVHLTSGVVRDVPELGITRANAHSGMHSEYNDRIYALDQPFDSSRRTKVLVVGNSFARDMANVILESDRGDAVDISYRFSEEPDSELVERIRQADVIFIQDYDKYTMLRSTVIDTLSHSPVWLIGTKSYGISNGRVYRHRGSPDYWLRSERPDPEFYAEYERELALCPPDRYLDFMSPVLEADGSVRVFTPDSMFISQDCRHLTPAGARYYARIFAPALKQIP